MENINIKKWVAENTQIDFESFMKTFGLYSGYGSIYGKGVGVGNINGQGTLYGYGYGYGDASGSGGEEGIGYGCGSAPGACDIDGSFKRYFNSYYSFRYIKSFNGQPVYMIDEIPTIISRVKGSIARGYVLRNDFTLTPCYVAAGDYHFGHGETAREAVEALRKKIFHSMSPDETINKFMKKFKPGEKYSGKVFFEWHHYLTGSCKMGRNAFVKNHGIDLDDKITVEEFITYCENDYGGEIIKRLKEKWNKKYLIIE